MVVFYGGKTTLASRIWPHFPRHLVYVEPFCGGATLLFMKPWPYTQNMHDYREIINDLDHNIVNFFRQMQDQNTRKILVEKLLYILYSREEYELAKQIMKNPDEYSSLDKAWGFYVNTHQSFGANLNTGWGTSKLTNNLAGTWHFKTAKLGAFADRLIAVHIENSDAIDCIKKWDSPHTLFYCDPPYIGTAQGIYKGYTQKNFEVLIDVLENCQGSFVLSSFPNESIDDKSWVSIELGSQGSIAKPTYIGQPRKMKKEMIYIADRHETASFKSRKTMKRIWAGILPPR